MSLFFRVRMSLPARHSTRIDKAFPSAKLNILSSRGIIDLSYKKIEASSSSKHSENGRRIAIISFNNPPANTFSLEQISEFQNIFKSVEADASTRGVILTSSLNNMFTAGVDLSTFSRDKQYLLEFWTSISSIFRQIYSSRLFTLSAINGHCLALGVVFALACQDRFMVEGNYKIGLNETQVGLPLPAWLIEALKLTVGNRLAEKYASDGIIIGVQEALKSGLIDRTFGSQDELLQQSLNYLQQRCAVPEYSQTKTIAVSRKDYLQVFDSKLNVAEFVDQIMKPDTQARINAAIKSLSNRNKSS
ncbi:Enoyl-CoA delta isomerase 1, mitochondrial [Smittium culicis]|uniref:Enoyl-CoA delta isomerase 1, mitochondrial n=1 Tax=Smittium culicis TaxID=133412 RepID=A0A1R1XI02_9FUNG|nr:Enoyl-CoA delta isomerase 1, mitochondrial [Smittium culicis]